jgi:hypothetical protein
MLFVVLFIVAAVVFALVMLLIALLRPKLRPTVVSPEVAQKHVPVICLIRGAEGLILVPLALFVVLIGAGFLSQFNPFSPAQNSNVYFSFVMLGLVLFVGAFFIARTVNRIRKADPPRFPNFWRVTENSISTFAFIFAAFAAHDVYQLMPDWKPQPHMPLLMPFLNRHFLWIVVFFLGRSCALTILRRVLELNPKTPPQNPAPPDQSGSGPFVPFNPYDLSKNPPLRPSPGSS